MARVLDDKRYPILVGKFQGSLNVRHCLHVDVIRCYTALEAVCWRSIVGWVLGRCEVETAALTFGLTTSPVRLCKY